MANNYFDIEGLHIEQEHCAMKVGTDSVLLGRWAAERLRRLRAERSGHADDGLRAERSGHADDGLRAERSGHAVGASLSVLDIGSGTGILALLIAKLMEAERILAIDIDEGAYAQTLINIRNNGLQGRVEARRISVQELAAARESENLSPRESENPSPREPENPRIRESEIPRARNLEPPRTRAFDYIVCNPPYFKNSLKCPDAQRNLARHNDSLSFRDLMQCSARLLKSGGRMAIIMPAEAKSEMDMEAAFAGFTTVAEEPIRTSERKPIKRWMVEYFLIKN